MVWEDVVALENDDADLCQLQAHSVRMLVLLQPRLHVRL
jgi:hypothetical protein